MGEQLSMADQVNIENIKRCLEHYSKKLNFTVKEVLKRETFYTVVLQSQANAFANIPFTRITMFDFNDKYIFLNIDTVDISQMLELKEIRDRLANVKEG